MDFDFNTTPSIRVARGGIRRMGAIATGLQARSVLVVSDRGLEASGLLGLALDSLTELGVTVTVFTEVQADPPEDVIQAAVQAAKAAGADCVFGIGGGSSLDTAKLAALLACGDQRLDQVFGVDQARGPRLPLVLVPTTAGTGSEVTPISIVTTGSGEKKGVVSRRLLPDIALLDAELTLGLPVTVTAATGIDAMVHAIEAFTSRRLKNPVSDCLAREAMRLLAGSIDTVCTSGADLDAREDMLLGACLAGMAFANAPVAAVHALAYPIGARFHVPHGLSNALVVGPVMRFNVPVAADLYAQLWDVIAPGAEGNAPSKASALTAYMSGLTRCYGLPSRLKDVGIAASDIQGLAEDAMKQTRLLVNNPRDLTERDAAQLYLEAL